MIAVGINLGTADGFDYSDGLEESTTLRLVGGIPYGSISGRVAEYFATKRTPLMNRDFQKQENGNSI